MAYVTKGITHKQFVKFCFFSKTIHLQGDIMKSRIFLCFVLTLFVIGLYSCRDDKPTTPTDGEIPSSNETHFEAEWREGTVYFDESETSTLIENDEENSVLVFSSSSDKAKNLKVGDVIVVHGLVLAKVSQISDNGSNITVNYVPAKLTEAILNGNIEWNMTTDFTKAKEVTLIIPGKGSQVQQVNPEFTDISYTGKFGDYTYKIDLGLGADEMDVKFDIKKKFGEYTSATFSTEGKVKKIASVNSIQITDSELTKFDSKNDNLRGELEVSMEVKAEAGSDNIGLEVPIVLIKYPFLVGPIPVVITMQVDFGIFYGIPLGAEAKSKVSASFSFDSEGGFSYNGTEVNYDYTAGNINLSKKEGLTGAPSPVYAEFGVSYPYITMNIFGNTVVPTFKTTFLIRGDYSPPVFGEPACHNAYLKFAGVAGVDLNLFNIDLYENDVQLWYKENHFLKEGCE